MKSFSGLWLLPAVLAAALLAPLDGRTDVSLEDPAVRILAKNCAVSGCHAGTSPMMNLSFAADGLAGRLIGKPSLVDPSRMLIRLDAPEKSYLLAKLRGDADISGKQMPLNRPPLSLSDQKVIQAWVLSLRTPDRDDRIGGEMMPNPARPDLPPFWGLSLANLPTTETVPAGRFDFRVFHRFFPDIGTGFSSLFGLDGPAAIWLGIGYGLSERIHLTVGRTNLANEFEASVRWRFLEENPFPFEAAVQAGLAWATERIGDRKTTDARNFKLNIQLSLAKKLSERFSVLVVPALSTRTDHWEPEPQNTFALGIGGRFLAAEGLSLIGEWVPVLAGYGAVSNGWGFGLEKKIGGHVFQVLIANSVGLTPDAYIPGGDLRLADGDLRFGFNIYRTF